MALQDDQPTPKKRPPKPRTMNPADVVKRHEKVAARHPSTAPPPAVDMRAKLAAIGQRIEELVIQGTLFPQISRQIEEEFHVNARSARLSRLHDAVLEELAKAGREQQTPKGREVAKVATLRRLHTMRGIALFGMTDPDTKKVIHRPNLLVAHLIEKQIARIMGLEAPRKLDVTIDVQSQAMAEILVGLDEDTRKELEAEARVEVEVLKSSNRLPPKVEEVEAESVEA